MIQLTSTKYQELLDYKKRYPKLLKLYQTQLVKSVEYQDQIQFLEWQLGKRTPETERYLV